MDNAIKRDVKVILSAYACSPIKGSEEGNGWNWVFNLAMQGYSIWCLTNTQDKVAIMDAKEKLKLTNLNFIFVKVPFGIDESFFDPASKKVYLHYLLWRRAAKKIALDMHKNLHFDIAHHVTYGSLQQGTFLWKLKGVKLIFGPVGGGQQAKASLRQYFGKAWITEQIRSLISRLSILFNENLKQTLKKASHVLVTNKETGDLIISSKYCDQSKISLISDNSVPSFMEDVAYPERNYTDPIKLLWIGRILPRKGLNLVLHALSYLPENVHYTFTIVGGGPWFDEVGKWIQQYKLNPKNIIIAGSIPFTDVIEYYKCSDIFVFCSLRDSRPNQIIEAMAFGLPSIVLNMHGSALDVIDTCGIKVDVTSADETAKGIAKAITKLYFDKKILASMSYCSYLNAKNNTWKKKVETVTNNFY